MTLATPIPDGDHPRLPRTRNQHIRGPVVTLRLPGGHLYLADLYTAGPAPTAKETTA